MTPREKRLVFAGIILGLALALVIIGAARLLPWESRAAQTEASAIAPAYEAPAENAESPAESHDHAGHQAAETGAVSSVQLSELEQEQIGVQTTQVRRRSLHRALLTVAKVDEPETQLASISARVGGRIDKLFVDFTGQPVRRGQAIALIYSPEVFTAAEEYRLALESRKRLGGSAEPPAISGADDLVAASRRRLELWGLTPEQIEQIATSPKPQVELTVYSPASGIVTERKVASGQYVNAGEALYTLTDLSTVWVKAEIYEPDLPAVHDRHEVEITSDSLPGTILHGQVGFIEPQVNPQTRTVSVRIQVSNPRMRLRPGMFVQAKFAAPAGRDTLAVPRSAVIDTGTRKVVYVARGNGVFEGRAVQLGPPGDDFYPVIAGLQEGERVVTQGNFLVDSQSRITGGMTGLFGGSKEFDHGKNEAPGADMKFSFRSDPATPKGGSQATVYVTLYDSSGKPVSDAQVKVALIMPAMPAMNMPEMRSEAVLSWNGSSYAGKVKVPTAGAWNVEVEASRGGQLLGSYRARLMAQ